MNSRNKLLAEKICEINSKELFNKIFDLTGWILKNEDFKAGIYPIDILNILDSLSENELLKIEEETKGYRIYTAIFVRYGYAKAYGRHKKEAMYIASHINPKKIHWKDDSFCFKIAPSYYVHEIKIVSDGVKRIIHLYEKKEVMNRAEIKEYIIENGIQLNGRYLIDYTFIQGSVVKKEKQIYIDF